MLERLKKLTTKATASTAKKAAASVRRKAALLPNGFIENQVGAPAFRGEAVLSQSYFRITDEDLTLNPLQVLVRGINNLYKNSKTVFKSKRRLIPALALALIWLLLIPLQLLEVNWAPVNILSFLTFAKGGLSSNLFHIIGGVIGKGIVAGLFLSFFTGQKPLQSQAGRIKQITNLIRSKSLCDIAALLCGIGTALIAYNFMVGHVSLGMSMAAVAGFILSLRALGKKTGFLKSLISSVIAKINKSKQFHTDFVNRMVAGISIGFALSIPLSATNIAMIGYLAGFLSLIAGLALSIISGKGKEVTV